MCMYCLSIQMNICVYLYTIIIILLGIFLFRIDQSDKIVYEAVFGFYMSNSKF